MLGPVKLYDLREPSPNKALERLKDLFYLGFACGGRGLGRGPGAVPVQDRRRPRAGAAAERGAGLGHRRDPRQLPLAAGRRGARPWATRSLSMERAHRRALPGRRARPGPRGAGVRQAESVALDDDEKRRIYGLGQELPRADAAASDRRPGRLRRRRARARAGAAAGAQRRLPPPGDPARPAGGRRTTWATGSACWTCSTARSSTSRTCRSRVHLVGLLVERAHGREPRCTSATCSRASSARTSS